MDLQSRFEAARDFLSAHSFLYQLEPLNRYPLGLKGPYDAWLEDLQGFTNEELIKVERSLDSAKLNGKLKTYIQKIRELCSLPILEGESLPIGSNLQIGMTEKKRHEVSRIKGFLSDKNFSSYIDVGSGKGHLSMALLEDRSGKSFCVDMDKALQKAGKEKINKYAKRLQERIHYQTARFDRSLRIPSEENALTIGLHSCGDLSVEALEFAQINGLSFLGFGCCYHKLTRYNLSKAAQKSPLEFSFHALNLAARSNRELSMEDFYRRLKVKRYRYALHMLLRSRFGADFAPLGNAKHTDYELPFSEYCAKHSPRPTEIDADRFFKELESSGELQKYLLAETIRGPLGRVIETYLALDRALYLEENGKKTQVGLLFDRSVSPRNIAIFAL